MRNTNQLELAGYCPKCTGPLYIGLTHSCLTGGLKYTPRFVGDIAPDNGIRESDPNHGGSLIPSQYSNAA